MVRLLVDIQAAWIGRVEALLAIGLPDWRGSTLTGAVSDVIERTRAELSADDAAALDRFVDELPRRFARIGAWIRWCTAISIPAMCVEAPQV
jgi:hypothetical protein